ncbi:hypothetical protein [Pseudoclavibacter sp. VKM Ac-2888]|uniref:hypothetical protein n=1 Tax=Pseudoclavibacter sp. VKM Ac-2888 TaxID=2783830 RepID=UPI00188A413E|nr:hypothetical protein [Pseudoclavibacter sp. VKM Ac-2888]MBF4549316.1 hypothetical protein [Pseudoclavibacter sp. VKM Ac-2888]
MWPFRRRSTTTDASDPAETFARPPVPEPVDDDVAEDSFWTESPASPRHPEYIDFADAVPARHPAMPLATILLDRPAPACRELPPTDLDAAVHDILNDLVGPAGRYRLVPRTPGETDGDEIFTKLIVQNVADRIGASIDEAFERQELEAPTAPVIAIEPHRARRG